MAKHDPRLMRQALQVLMTPDQVVELRVLGASTSDHPRPHVVSGYFDDLDKLVKIASSITAKGLYVTVNPLNPALLARANNRVRVQGDHGASTSDADVQARHWLLIDGDPVRPTEISSSDAEHQLALARAQDIRSVLAEMGWAPPVLADSGNGGHLLYRINLPNDENSRELVKHVLEAFAFRFDDAHMSIDQKVFNAARIWKLYGSVACKGDNTSERPHRLSRLLEIRVNLDLWYPVPPTKGGHRHGNITVRRSSDPPHRGAGFD